MYLIGTLLRNASYVKNSSVLYHQFRLHVHPARQKAAVPDNRRFGSAKAFSRIGNNDVPKAKTKHGGAALMAALKAFASRKYAVLSAILTVIALIWALTLFGSSSSAGLNPDSAANTVLLNGGLQARTDTGAEPVIALHTSTLTVELSDEENRPVTGATLEMTVDMKSMHHPLPKTEMTETSPGVYAGEFVPVMSGKWFAEISAAAGGRTFTFSHSFTVKR